MERRRAPPSEWSHSRRLRRTPRILAVALLFSLLGLALALPPDPGMLDQAGPPRQPATLGSLAVILRKGVSFLTGPFKFILKVVATRAALLFSAGTVASWLLWKHFERERENERREEEEEEERRMEEEEEEERWMKEEEEAAEKEAGEEREQENEQKRRKEQEGEEEERREKERDENRQKKKKNDEDAKRYFKDQDDLKLRAAREAAGKKAAPKEEALNWKAPRGGDDKGEPGFWEWLGWISLVLIILGKFVDHHSRNVTGTTKAGAPCKNCLKQGGLCAQHGGTPPRS
ncbi:hypothetical protein T484DRAFT_1985382 [Baffinella frigidus]|nr:hypothetical protein T484DRAFT_1985382 [Cryptophyta sp. CCMP2293]